MTRAIRYAATSVACRDWGIRGSSDPFARKKSARKGDDAMEAVRFDTYGDIDVLKVVEVDPPVAGPGHVVVRMKAAGINPGGGVHPQRASGGALAGHFPLRAR